MQQSVMPDGLTCLLCKLQSALFSLDWTCVAMHAPLKACTQACRAARAERRRAIERRRIWQCPARQAGA